ncbi:hypothetical protein EDD16DRAFT_1523562 [Pisolithus croceorrhizus]|nr:hypothetical protein EDD16DRAFT_1523562 [Pisolithus croceorrhizus]
MSEGSALVSVTCLSWLRWHGKASANEAKFDRGVSVIQNGTRLWGEWNLALPRKFMASDVTHGKRGWVVKDLSTIDLSYSHERQASHLFYKRIGIPKSNLYSNATHLVYFRAILAHRGCFSKVPSTDAFGKST